MVALSRAGVQVRKHHFHDIFTYRGRVTHFTMFCFMYPTGEVGNDPLMREVFDFLSDDK